MSGKNAEEYRKLVGVTVKLTDIMADGDNVVTLSQGVFGAGLISKANNRKMANSHVSTDVRAAQLLSMVMTKVELNSSNYNKFVGVLKQDETTYGEILKDLDVDTGRVQVDNPTQAPQSQRKRDCISFLAPFVIAIGTTVGGAIGAGIGAAVGAIIFHTVENVDAGVSIGAGAAIGAAIMTPVVLIVFTVVYYRCCYKRNS